MRANFDTVFGEIGGCRVNHQYSVSIDSVVIPKKFLLSIVEIMYVFVETFYYLFRWWGPKTRYVTFLFTFYSGRVKVRQKMPKYIKRMGFSSFLSSMRDKPLTSLNFMVHEPTRTHSIAKIKKKRFIHFIVSPSTSTEFMCFVSHLSANAIAWSMWVAFFFTFTFFFLLKKIDYLTRAHTQTLLHHFTKQNILHKFILYDCSTGAINR